MECDVVAVEETSQIEIEVKLNTSKLDSQSMEANENNRKMIVKNHNYEYTDEIDSKRIKHEKDNTDSWIECDVKNEETLEIPFEKIKLEIDLESKGIAIEEITEGLIIKNESDCYNFMEPTAETLLNSAVKCEQHHAMWKEANMKWFSCYNCDYSARHKRHLINHMEKHNNRRNMQCNAKLKCYPIFDGHPVGHCTYETTIKSSLHSKCIQCNAIFKSKANLDEHTIQKHPDLIASVVSNKIHECTLCTYKTVKKSNLDRHMLKHSDAIGSYKLRKCKQCNATFKSKIGLDGHTIRKHPDLVASVSSKIHKCTFCTYKTTVKSSLDRHVLKHSDVSGIKCMHCNATFKSKSSLDGHTIRKHPGSIASVSSKIHQCIHCTYKTTSTSNLNRHVMKHSDGSSRLELSECMHCNATFSGKTNLDDHIIRKHPDFIASVSSKIHECIHCTYKTTLKGSLSNHMLIHPNATSSYKLSRCIHCDAAFKSEQRLDDHIIQNHPDFSTSVSSKTHECILCTYKTAFKNKLDRHMFKHPEIKGSYEFRKCSHCDATFRGKIDLDEHTIRKHPDFIASVSSKIHECTLCTYKTTRTNHFHTHMLKHPETASRYKLRRCMHCSATFKRKEMLDNHIIWKHPGFIASVSSKIHECAHCTYKTTRKSYFVSHMLQHNNSTSSYELSKCIHCNAIFTCKTNLDDHTIRNHPDFISSISSKIHECTDCTYKTAKKSYLVRHMLQHIDGTSIYQLGKCMHCNATFKRKQCLDDHTIQNHPDFIASVSSKIHECTLCTFKTTFRSSLGKHVLNHHNSTTNGPV